MNEKTLKLIQIAVEVSILSCFLAGLPPLYKIAEFAHKNPLASRQGFAVRVVNDDSNPAPVKVYTELLKTTNGYRHRYEMPLPVQVYTGHEGIDGDGNFRRRFDVPIPVTAK